MNFSLHTSCNHSSVFSNNTTSNSSAGGAGDADNNSSAAAPVQTVEISEAAERAASTAASTFAGGAGEALPSIDAASDGIGLVEALTALGFAASNKEARRKIGEGAVRVDGIRVDDPQLSITPESTPVRVSLGAKRHGLVVPKR